MYSHMYEKKTTLFHLELGKRRIQKRQLEERRRNKEKKKKEKIEMCISEITWVDRVQQYSPLFLFVVRNYIIKYVLIFIRILLKRHEKVQIVFFPSLFLYIFAWFEGKIKNHENIS